MNGGMYELRNDVYIYQSCAWQDVFARYIYEEKKTENCKISVLPRAVFFEL